MSLKKINLYEMTPNELKELIGDSINEKIEKLKPPEEKRDQEDLLTVDETLKLLKCSKQALWNWRKNGILPSYRLGNRVYYKKSDILNKLVRQ